MSSRRDGADAWRYLCTVGLVFKLAHGLLKQLRAENHPVALGYQAARLPRSRGAWARSRTWCRCRARTASSPATACACCRDAAPGPAGALMEVAGVKPRAGSCRATFRFRLGPRINASGRLADAALSVELLLSDDEQFCAETAARSSIVQPRAAGHRAPHHRGGRAVD
jgi:single-stranded-DNA-specific exonuclease